jgi:Ca2+-binding RTX toxin-like protein
MSGGSGDDTYMVDNIGDVVQESPNQGIDTVRAFVSFMLSGDVENLTLGGNQAINGTGNDLANILMGNTANNILEGGLGDDEIHGGDGDDELIAGDGNDTLDGGAGHDTMSGGDGDDTYEFAIGYGLETITDSAGNDAIRFGSNITEDNISVESDENGVYIRVLDADGNDTGEGIDMNLVADDAPAIETILFSDGSTKLVTDFLNTTNIVYGTNGWDCIRTGDTQDIIYALNGFDRVYAGANDDVIYGGNGTDWLYGQAGNDTLMGGAGFDALFGGDGNDTLDGGSGFNWMVGGRGDDTYIVDSRYDYVMEYSNQGNDTVKSSISYSLGWNVENLVLTGDSNTNGTGNHQNNMIIGNSGNNKIKGGWGDDTLAGGAGIDRLYGEQGSDTYKFGRGYGQDTISETSAYNWWWFRNNDTDTLAFGEDIQADQIWFDRSGRDLVASIIGTQDSVTIKDWFHKRHGQSIEKFTVSDGAALLNNQVDALVNAMAQFAPPSMGETTLPDDYKTVLSPVIAASWK